MIHFWIVNKSQSFKHGFVNIYFVGILQVLYGVCISKDQDFGNFELSPIQIYVLPYYTAVAISFFWSMTANLGMDRSGQIA